MGFIGGFGSANGDRTRTLSLERVEEGLFGAE